MNFKQILIIVFWFLFFFYWNYNFWLINFNWWKLLYSNDNYIYDWDFSICSWTITSSMNWWRRKEYREWWTWSCIWWTYIMQQASWANTNQININSWSITSNFNQFILIDNNKKYYSCIKIKNNNSNTQAWISLQFASDTSYIWWYTNTTSNSWIHCFEVSSWTTANINWAKYVDIRIRSTNMSAYTWVVHEFDDIWFYEAQNFEKNYINIDKNFFVYLFLIFNLLFFIILIKKIWIILNS